MLKSVAELCFVRHVIRHTGHTVHVEISGWSLSQWFLVSLDLRALGMQVCEHVRQQELTLYLRALGMRVCEQESEEVARTRITLATFFSSVPFFHESHLRRFSRAYPFSPLALFLHVLERCVVWALERCINVTAIPRIQQQIC